MADAGGAWDDDDFEPQVVNPSVNPTAVTDKWEGEDEVDVKDNWDDEEESEKKPTVTQVKKKKPLAERIAEKEAERKAAKEAERKAQQEAESKTPEDDLAEKIRQQRLQEEADLEIAKDAFGISNDELAGRTGIEAMNPSSITDFEEFGNALKDKISKYESSAFYVGFLETLYRDLALSLEPEDVKKLSSTLTAVANEKTKAQKAKKKKPKKAGVVKMDREEDHIDDDYGDFDDFI